MRLVPDCSCMDDGMIVEDGSPREIFANPQQERTKSFLSHVL